MISKIRVLVQIMIIVGLVLVESFIVYEHHVDKFGGKAVIENSLIQKNIDRFASKIEDRDKRKEILTYVQGNIWSLQIGSLKITDPLAFVENLVKTKSFYLPLFIAILIPILFTLFFGRIFCGWICPAAILFQFISKMREALLYLGIPLPNLKLSGKIKYYLLGISIFTGLILNFSFVSFIYPPKMISIEIFFFVTKSVFSSGFMFLIFILIFDLLFGKRLWCRSICPGGAIYSTLSKFSVLKIQNDIEKCTDCGICDKLCPYALTPSKNEYFLSCDQCGICIDKCPDKTIKFKLELPRKMRRGKSEN